MERPLRPLGFVGLAVIAAAIAVTLASPLAMGPLPDGLRTPVLAFELARTEDEIEAMFGERHGIERAQRVSAMRTGTCLDFVLIGCYAWLLSGVARRLLRALGLGLGMPTALRRTRAAVTLAWAAAALDVLENLELLAILDGVVGNTSRYAAALDRLQWLVWPKWIALAAWFVVLAPELFMAKGALRVAAVAGVIAAAACGFAITERGLFAEAMALGVAVGMAALAVGCLRARPAPPAPSPSS